MGSSFRFLLAFSAPLTFLAGVWLGGAWTFLTVGYTYILIPLLEPLVGYDRGAGESPSGS